MDNYEKWIQKVIKAKILLTEVKEIRDDLVIKDVDKTIKDCDNLILNLKIHKTYFEDRI